MSPSPRLLLVGMTLSGKSVLGAALGAKTGWPYIDSEVLLLRSTGRSAADLAAERGEGGLRAARSDVLTMLLGLPGPYVAELNQDVVLDDADRKRLVAVDATVVWVRASVPTLARRAGQRLGPQPRQVLQQMCLLAEPVLAEVADIVVDVDLQPTGQLVRSILQAVGS